MRKLGVYFLNGEHIHTGNGIYGTLETGETICSELLENILDRFNDDVVTMEMESEEDTTLTLEFGKGRECFIGFIEEEDTIYYFNNGSNELEFVDLLINVCPEKRMLCYAIDDVKKIIRHFFKTGKRDRTYRWILDDMSEL